MFAEFSTAGSIAAAVTCVAFFIFKRRADTIGFHSSATYSTEFIAFVMLMVTLFANFDAVEQSFFDFPDNFLTFDVFFVHFLYHIDQRDREAAFLSAANIRS